MGRRGGEEEGSSDRKNETIGIRLFFVLMLYIKFQVPGSSGSLVLTQSKAVTEGKGHNSLRNSVKSHLKIDPKQSPGFWDPSSSNSLYIVLTRFFYCYKI